MSAAQRRIRNVLLAMTFASWGVLRFVSAESVEDRWSVGQLAPCALHFVAAWLFLVRSPSLQEGSVGDIAAAIPSFVAGGVIMLLAPEPSTWPLTAQVIFVTGATGAVLSLLSLGKSFAIFPALREVVSRGPYRLVRHPAYLFELVMLIGALLSCGWQVGLLLPVAVALFVLRIVTEERVLNLSPSYRLYCEKVRYRLVPLIW